MTLTLTPSTETRLRELAARRGQAPEDMIEEVIDALVQREMTADAPVPENQAMPPKAHIDPTLALFAQWAIEDVTDDPEEIARRNREWEETKANLAANRFSLEGRTDFKALLGDDSQDK